MSGQEPSSEHEMFSIGVCWSCKSGPLGLRRCGRCGRVVMLCDECDAAYLDYSDEAQATFATEEEMPCPRCGADLWDPEARWATESDLAQEPSIVELIENERVTLERGAPFSRGSFGSTDERG